VAFLDGRLFSANHGFLKTFQIVLIGWIKAGPPKSHFCFDLVNRLIMQFSYRGAKGVGRKFSRGATEKRPKISKKCAENSTI